MTCHIVPTNRGVQPLIVKSHVDGFSTLPSESSVHWQIVLVRAKSLGKTKVTHAWGKETIPETHVTHMEFAGIVSWYVQLGTKSQIGRLDVQLDEIQEAAGA